MKRFLFALFLIPNLAFADRFDTAKSRNSGDYVETYAVTPTTYSAVECVDNDTAIKSANIDVFNNSAYTLWVGTNTTALRASGLPILSSKTYTMDGQYTGSLYCMEDITAGGNGDVRVIYFLKSDYAR